MRASSTAQVTDLARASARSRRLSHSRVPSASALDALSAFALAVACRRGDKRKVGTGGYMNAVAEPRPGSQHEHLLSAPVGSRRCKPGAAPQIDVSGETKAATKSTTPNTNTSNDRRAKLVTSRFLSSRRRRTAATTRSAGIGAAVPRFRAACGSVHGKTSIARANHLSGHDSGGGQG